MTKFDLEEMIAKKKKSLYSFGKRSSDSLKTKNIKTQEAIIIGYTAPKGARTESVIGAVAEILLTQSRTSNFNALMFVSEWICNHTYIQ